MHKHGHVTPLEDTFCTQRYVVRCSGVAEGCEVAGREWGVSRE